VYDDVQGSCNSGIMVTGNITHHSAASTTSMMLVQFQYYYSQEQELGQCQNCNRREWYILSACNTAQYLVQSLINNDIIESIYCVMIDFDVDDNQLSLLLPSFGLPAVQVHHSDNKGVKNNDVTEDDNVQKDDGILALFSFLLLFFFLFKKGSHS
jgi:hypothetical protein